MSESVTFTGKCPQCGYSDKSQVKQVSNVMNSYKNEKGERVFTRYTFSLAEDKWEPVITPLGQAAPEGDGGYVEDNLLGKDCALINDVLEYTGKTKRYIPSRSDLLKRTKDSLKDMLDDLKKEV